MNNNKFVKKNRNPLADSGISGKTRRDSVMTKSITSNNKEKDGACCKESCYIF